ncbi:thioredoxin family protein [Clostridium chauvoei]|uniref:Thioredoxin family protein n=2 Tax=Clostridium chauvoei TaxID=46867 RepID=A0ABD4RDQ6_9CLOT|nr:thioredoxin family protein [Clostridium chauvoei]ATD55029.1 thiol reductase thioredoxin [Clostridium chauvoei]ATD57295.1 thiol reductase thioredoxin [Clostridium chauvoei]MBX7279369.1 thioredoxin family protein [Clostridium chauvoei]MBX7283859.1 thioredoxin family protein [Clostridium chauvoei]MBX7285567.1 thioredoxin family protein [Clostridium chauvoei]
MNVLNNMKELKEFINKNSLSCIYFSTNTCTACQALKPKIESLVNKFECIQISEVKADKSLEVSAQLNLFMLPAIIFFIDGKESFRESKYISILELESKLNRLIELYK